MRRKKFSSAVLNKASRRLAGLRSIQPKLDLGDGLGVAGLEAAIKSTSDDLAHHNRLLSDLDALETRIEEGEASLRDMTVRSLSAVSAKFGPDSTQYEQAGGVRRSLRARRGTGIKAHRAAIKAAQSASTQASAAPAAIPATAVPTPALLNGHALP